MNEKIFSMSKDVLWEDLEAGIAITQPGTSRVFMFNATGSAIWHLLDGQTSLEDLVSRLSMKFEQPPEIIFQDVVSFISRISELDLIIEKE